MIQQQMHQQKILQQSSMRNNGPPFSGPISRLNGISLKSSPSAVGASSVALSTSGSPVANSLLRFSVDALTGNGAADNNSIGQLNNSEDTKLDLSNLSLMNMAARLGYGGYFGGLGGFTQLNQLNQAFNELGVLDPNNVGGSNVSNTNGPLGAAHSASSGQVMTDEEDDDDLLGNSMSINSWDDCEPALDSDEEDFKAVAIAKKTSKRNGKRPLASKIKLESIERSLNVNKTKIESSNKSTIEDLTGMEDEDEEMDDDHNIDIMEDNETIAHKYNSQAKQAAPMAS